jgi:hypothetical protein
MVASMGNTRRSVHLGRLSIAAACLLALLPGTVATSAMPTRAQRNAADPVVTAAGDIACDPRSDAFQRHGPAGCGMSRTAALVRSIDPDAVLTLGDNQYVCGAYPAFEKSFDATWGRFGDRLHPTPGDHEYFTEASGGPPCSAAPNALGYFRYFGSRAVGRAGDSWYSFGLRTSAGTMWHIVSLNSNCEHIRGGCGRGSAEERWLRQDLANHPRTCTLAYMYDPRFSSGNHGNNTDVSRLWYDLYRAGVELVLDGHSHDYERFAPQTPSGRYSPTGIREVVVGTGGIGLYPLGKPQPRSQFASTASLGVLRLALHPGSYSWRFVPTKAGAVTDSGTAACHGPNP